MTNYAKNLILKQWRRGGGFKDFCFFYKILINQAPALVIFAVYFPHQIGIIIHVTIPKVR